VTMLLDEPAATAPTAARGREVLIAHEWLVSYHGSECVVDELISAYPGAHLVTSLIVRERVPLTLQHAEPSLLQKNPGGDFAA
jgi:hypothetical protein